MRRYNPAGIRPASSSAIRPSTPLPSGTRVPPPLEYKPQVPRTCGDSLRPVTLVPAGTSSGKYCSNRESFWKSDLVGPSGRPLPLPCFILHPSIDLYGDPESWSRFVAGLGPGRGRRPTIVVPPRLPIVTFLTTLNFFRAIALTCGSRIPAPRTGSPKNYQCCACRLCSGLLRPSHPKGAKWIDPADFSFNVSGTLQAAEECDAAAFGI
jgi:hypothetical protein